MNTIEGRLDQLTRRSLDRIASAAAGLLDVPVVLISVLEGDRHSHVGTHGFATTQTKMRSPLCREVAIGGRPIVLQDVRRRLRVGARDVLGLQFVAYAGVAMGLLAPTRAGALAALSPAPRAWQRQDLHVLRCLADAAAAVLDARAGYDEIIGDHQRGVAHEIEVALEEGRSRTLELEKTSLHDELTGLLNRRGLFAFAPAQLEAMHRQSVQGLLLYVDLDGLKETNDRHGHSAGDELLRSAATVLRAAFRNVDTIARLGGDEFVVIATDIDRDEHPAILARLAIELGNANQHRDPSMPLAWSLGVVAIEPTATLSLDDLMSAADQRMYSAKRALFAVP